MTTDRLGSIRARDNGERYPYYPYGEAKTESGGMYAGLESPARNDDEGAGRFDRPDPQAMRGVVMGNPGSWNRFAYTTGDQLNTSVTIPLNNTLTGASFVSGNVDDWAVTILHEPGHAFYDLYGSAASQITPDTGNTAASQANTALIKRNCKP